MAFRLTQLDLVASLLGLLWAELLDLSFMLPSFFISPPLLPDLADFGEGGMDGEDEFSTMRHGDLDDVFTGEFLAELRLSGFGDPLAEEEEEDLG